MADEDKTEEPTAKKRQKSHSEGQFAKAPEINTAMVLFVMVILLALLTPRKAREISMFTTHLLGHLHETEVTLDGIVGTLVSFAKFIMIFMVIKIQYFFKSNCSRQIISKKVARN